MYNQKMPASRIEREVKAASYRTPPKEIFKEYQMGAEQFSRLYRGNKMDARNDPYFPLNTT